MQYDGSALRRIYDRTSGYCHICKRKMSFTNYGMARKKGAWEVEHSVPRAKGGTDHGNNLFGAHITCNREKSDFTTQTARSWHGNIPGDILYGEHILHRRSLRFPQDASARGLLLHPMGGSRKARDWRCRPQDVSCQICHWGSEWRSFLTPKEKS